MQSRTDSSRETTWFPLLAGSLAFAVTCGVFWCFNDPWTLRGDNKAVIFPMNLEAFRMWMSGRPPEWSDGFWAGFPLLSDPTSLSFYWPNLLAFMAAPQFRAFDLSTAMHAAILVAGLVHLLLMLGTRPAAALIAGALMLIAPMHLWFASAILTLYAPVAWWPWLLVAAEYLGRDGLSWRAILLGWLALATSALVFPEFAFYGGVVAVLWLLSDVRRGFFDRARSAVVMGAGGVALAAPQLMPALSLLADTMRGTQDVRATDIAELTFSASTFLYPSLDDRLPSFLGIATLTVAAIGVLRRPPRVYFLAALAAVSLVLAHGEGTPFYSSLRVLPGFDLFRSALKFKLLTELAVICLVGFGIDHVLRSSWDRVALRFAWLLIAFMVAENLTYAAVRVSTGSGLPGAADSGFSELLVRARDSGLVRYVAAQRSIPKPRASEEVNLRAVPMVDGVPLLGGGPNSLLPRRHRLIVGAYSAFPGPTRREMDYFGVGFDLRVDPAADSPDRNPCQTYAIERKVLMVGRSAGTCLYATTTPAGRFAIPTSVRAAASVDEMVQSVVDELSELPYVRTSHVEQVECPTVPPTSTKAIVESATLLLQETVPVVAPTRETARFAPAAGRVLVTDYQPGNVNLVSIASRPTFLLARESYYQGWRAWVDGRPAPVYPAAGLFFAVPVPEGQHEVYLSYRAPGFATGVRIALSWVVAACLVELARRGFGSRRPTLEA